MDRDYFFPGGDFSVGTHERAHLSIHGNGRGARVVVEGSWELREWAAVRLVDFDIVLGEDGCIVPDGVSDVEIQGMRISGGSSAERMVRAYGFERLQVTGSVLQARVFDTLEGHTWSPKASTRCGGHGTSTTKNSCARRCLTLLCKPLRSTQRPEPIWLPSCEKAFPGCATRYHSVRKRRSPGSHSR
jgi:hypothetical protein